MKGALMYHMVHELKVHGKSIQAISKELGIHRVTVRKLLKKDPDEVHEYFAFQVIRRSEFDQYFKYCQVLNIVILFAFKIMFSFFP